MGVGIAFARAFALHDSYSWTFSLEFSLVAVFSFSSRDLRCRGVASATGSSIAATAALVLTAGTTIAMLMLRTTGSYAFPLTWIFLGLAAFWYLWEVALRDSEFQKWAPVAITFSALLATYIYIPTNCGVPTYNFSRQLLKPAPLDPARLYLSVYPWAELTYCVSNKPQPVGEVLRPGSTPMWGGLHFINGYSPIRPAGVAREFATSIHGEINPDVGSYLLNNQAGKDGELALLGVDGIVVARELDITPQPTSEWEAVLTTDEGRVFHRRGPPFARVRSLTSIDSRPGEQFAAATVSRINDSPKSSRSGCGCPQWRSSGVCSLFPGHIFADTKQNSAIENSPSRRIADYFQLSKSQLALMDGLLSFINQLG